MSQYKIGTVNLTNGSATVTGVGTEWLANAASGNLFVAVGDFVSYEVSGIVSDTELTLVAPYGGTTRTDANYVLHKDFFPNNNIPKLQNGDVEVPNIQNRANQALDNIAISPNNITAKTGPTGATILAVGSVAQRPASPQLGYARGNSDTNQMEQWNGTAWVEWVSQDSQTGSINTPRGTTLQRSPGLNPGGFRFNTDDDGLEYQLNSGDWESVPKGSSTKFSYYVAPNISFLKARESFTAEISGSPAGPFISSDGTKAYLAQFSPGVIYEYDITDGDINTKVYTGRSFANAAQASNIQGFVLNNDLTKLLIIENNTDSIWEYDLTAGELDTVSYTGNSTSISADDGSPQDIAISPDGLNIYYSGQSNNGVGHIVLTTDCVLTTETSRDYLALGLTNVTGIGISADGTLLTIATLSAGIFKYLMTTAGSITGMLAAGYTLNINSEGFSSNCQGLCFDGDGSDVYFTNAGTTEVIQLNSTFAY